MDGSPKGLFRLGDLGKDVKPLHTTSAVVASVGYTLLYVGLLYVRKPTRPSPRLSRDTPSVIRQRIRMVYIACAISCISTFQLLSWHGGRDAYTTLALMGLWPINARDILSGLSLTAVLFMGPLLERFFLDEGAGEMWSDTKLSLKSWTGWRNYVVGPLTEEITFRTCIIAVHLATSSPSLKGITLLTPLYFGIAHFHHFYEFVLTHPDSVLIAILRSVVQFTYTTIFGWYAAFLYIRLGSLWTVVLVHSFCNSMGVPRLFGRVEDDSAIKTIIYYVTLVAGAVLFHRFLWTWTESAQSLT